MRTQRTRRGNECRTVGKRLALNRNHIQKRRVIQPTRSSVPRAPAGHAAIRWGREWGTEGGPPSVKMAWEREEQSFILVAAVDRRSFPLLISLMIPVPAPRPVPSLPSSHPLKHRSSRHPSLSPLPLPSRHSCCGSPGGEGASVCCVFNGRCCQ